MPEEFSRTTKRKRVNLAGGFVDIPVITSISFIDPVDRSQETQHAIDNSSQSDREVHVDTIHSRDSNGQPSLGTSLDVERIDIWKYIDPQERYQESNLSLDNKTQNVPPDAPPWFITHFKTHVARYKNPDNPALWIDSELIDEFAIVDPVDRYQESHYFLNNPQTDDEAQANPDDPEISDSANGIDPPWRTDPFQNIVNFSGASPSTSVPAVAISSTGMYGGGFSGPVFCTPRNGDPDAFEWFGTTSAGNFGALVKGTMGGCPGNQSMDADHGLVAQRVSGTTIIGTWAIATDAGPVDPIELSFDYSGVTFTSEGTHGHTYSVAAGSHWFVQPGSGGVPVYYTMVLELA
jgi:hypothetical protein